MESIKVVKCTYVLQYSLHKRTVPKCSVLQALVLKQCNNRNMHDAIVNIGNKYFLPLNIHFAAKFGFLILCICLPDFGGVGLVGATF